MNSKINYKIINLILTIIVLILILGIGIYFNIFDLIGKIFLALIPFYIGFFLSWVLEPISNFLTNKIKIKKSISNFISISLSILVILIVMLVLIPLVLLQAWQLIQEFPQVWQGFNDNLGALYPIQSFKIDPEKIHALVSEKIQAIGIENLFGYATSSIFALSEGIGYIVKFLLTVGGIIAQIIFGYVIAFYFMGSIKNFVKALTNLIGGSNSKKYQKILISMSKALFSYLRGVIIICAFVGVFMTIGTSLIGLETPLLFGFISALTNVIPYLGPILGGIPIFIVALSIGYKQALLVIILIGSIQFVEAYFLVPKVMSKTVDIHPVSIMVGLLISHVLFGFIGLIIATPLMAMINVIIENTSLKGKIKL